MVEVTDILLKNFEADSPTIISAYFDIGRKNRDAEWYISWLEKTLEIPANFVIFTQQEHFARISAIKRNNGYKFKVVTKAVQDLPYYKYLGQIKNIQSEKHYRKTLRNAKDRIESYEPLYTMVDFSKYSLVLEGIRVSNEFWPRADKFVWMDAGIFAF